jgi:hypothetical protein
MQRRFIPVVTLATMALCLHLAGDSRAQVSSAIRPIEAKRSPEQTAGVRSLNNSLPEIRISDATLGDAIDFIRDASGANIHVNWRALAELNVTREMPINMRLRSVSLRSVLKLLLADVGSGLLTFYVDDGVIEVTTRELADQQLITRVYPVEDLIMEIPNFTDAPDFQIQSSTGGRGGSGNNSIFTGSMSSETREGKTDAERGQELVDVIMDTIQPEVWRENGGPASIRFFRGKLIVTAPRSVQESIGGPVD